MGRTNALSAQERYAGHHPIAWTTRVSNENPYSTIWEAAAPPQSQGFMLVGTLFIIPFILGYTFWSYYVFRGKVTHEDGYH